MGFISKIATNRKTIITVFRIFTLVIIALCGLCFNFYTKLDKLTNPNYFPPELETLFLSEINISESEILSIEHIKDAIKDVSDQNIAFSDESGNRIADYESMPNSLKLLIDDFIDGIIIRKNYQVTREKLISNLIFYASEGYVYFMFSFSSIRYVYAYFPDGEIHKTLVSNYIGKLKMANHYIEGDKIGVQTFFDNPLHIMFNDGESITKNSASSPGKRTYDKPSAMKISVEDYDLFLSDYLEGVVPRGFKLTIENIHRYIGKKYK